MQGEDFRQAGQVSPDNAKTGGWQNILEKGVLLSRTCRTRFKTFMRIELSLGYDV